MSAAIRTPGHVDATIHVDGRPIGLRIRLLSPHERETVAASMAWLATTSVAEACKVDRPAWTTFVENVLTPYVDFDIDLEELEPLTSAWWGEAIREAVSAFIQANDLGTSVKQFLATFCASDSDRQLIP